MSSVSERSDLDERYKWDLQSLFETDEEWQTAYETVESALDDLREFEGKTTEDAETLLALLERYEEVMREVANVSAYARMRRDEDTRDGERQAMATRAQSLASEASSATSFIEPELQELDDEDIEELIEAKPELRAYNHFFDDILRMKPHTRSAEI
jgi:oligoendopeptidase F